MFQTFEKIKSSRVNYLLIVVFTALFLIGCAVEAAKTSEKTSDKTPAKSAKSEAAAVETKASTANSRIEIQPESPADTVRVFYKNLREKKFREAMFLTNLRPAIEGLTENELKDLQLDFAALAAQIPAEIEINGEIISNDKATVTAKLPDNETGEMKLQQINLRGENGVWTILTVDEAAETLIKKEGKNYFFALRTETHHAEAKAMLNRVAKAEMIYASQNNGQFGEIPALIEKNLLPDDARTPQTTGYVYAVELSPDKKNYKATATPAEYGKTGKLSFRFQSGGAKKMIIEGRDLKGQTPKF